MGERVEYLVLTLGPVAEPVMGDGLLSGSVSLYLKWRRDLPGEEPRYFQPWDLAEELAEFAAAGWRIVAAPTHTAGSQLVLERTPEAQDEHYRRLARIAVGMGMAKPSSDPTP